MEKIMDNEMETGVIWGSRVGSVCTEPYSMPCYAHPQPIKSQYTIVASTLFSIIPP